MLLKLAFLVLVLASIGCLADSSDPKDKCREPQCYENTLVANAKMDYLLQFLGAQNKTSNSNGTFWILAGLFVLILND